ncbi:MAG: class I SAM-dependent methyltransferase [Candidatus Hydrogenedentota bacterium]
MHFIDLFSEKANLYASARPTYPEELFAYLASVAPARDRAWDCATGNGQAARDLVRHFAHVDATDASAAQIANATPCERVYYSVQPAEHTEFEDDSFDVVCVAQALHWFDYGRFFPEVHRVLKLGGIFAAWIYDWMNVSEEIDRQLKVSLLAPVKPYWARENTLAWGGYKDVPFPFEPLDVPKIPMRFEWDLFQMMAYVHTWSAVRRCMNETGNDFFERAGEELTAVWGDPSEKKTVTMRFHVIAGRHATT